MLLTTAALISAIACHDALTGPNAPALAPTSGRSATAGLMQGLFPIPTAANNGEANGGAVAWTSTGMSVKPWTSYIVRVSGSITASPIGGSPCGYNGGYPAAGTYAPWGGDYNTLRVFLGWMKDGSRSDFQYSGLSSTEVWSDTLFTWSGGDLQVARGGVAGEIGGGTPYCYSPLYILSGGESVSLETFDGQEIAVAPGGMFRRGTWVPFTATSQGSTLSWVNSMFIRDPADSNPGSTGACGYSGPNPCWVQVNNNGILRVARDLQRRMRSAEVPVRVYSFFELRADRTNISAGDTVRFTPLADSSTGPASRWLWRADNNTQVLAPCARMAGSDCLYAPLSSGYMWAYTGSGDSASARVYVVPCPTNDSLLDTETMRVGLGFLMDKTRVADPTQRRENAAWIFRDTLTGKQTFSWYQAQNDGCSIAVVLEDWMYPANSVAVGNAHAHPFVKDERVPPGICRYAKQGGAGTSKISPGDSLNAVNGGKPFYVVDRDSIYRADPDGTHKSWPRQTSSCTDLLPPKPSLNRLPIAPLRLKP